MIDIYEHCPQCGLHILHGMYIEGWEKRIERLKLGKVWGIHKEVQIDDCDAAWLGCSISDEIFCPKCGTNVSYIKSEENNAKVFLDILEEWQGKIENLQGIHFLKAGKCQKLHYYIGLPSIIFNVIATSMIFLNTTLFSLMFYISFIPLLSAILTSIQTFYSHVKLAEKHLYVSSQLGRLKRHIDVLKLAQSKNGNIEVILKDLNEQLDSIVKDSPVISLDDIKFHQEAENSYQVSKSIPAQTLRDNYR